MVKRRSVGAVRIAIGALVAAVAIVAVPASAGGTSEGAGGAKSLSAKSAYIVQMVLQPAVTYSGGIPGYKATKPARGAKLDPLDADVVSYVGLLNSKHDAALSAVGGGAELYDYDYAFNGFAARLTPDQKAALEARADVVSVARDTAATVDTTSTAQFLGLSGATGIWNRLGAKGENVIIADIDTGVWPENPAFTDRVGVGPNGQTGKLGYQQIPGWHGKCTPGEAFTASDCNQKLIGAQWFVAGHGGPDSIISEEYLSARDFDGHGSHTSSTAGGNADTATAGDAFAAGLRTINGMAPRARLAEYKACWELPDHSQVSCFTSDTTAAIDTAVRDGVDVITYSISGTATSFLNPVEVAFLNAASAGVFVSASAGNDGPTASTVAHPSPWIATVAASTHDRFGAGSATVGGTTYSGASLAGASATGTLILSTNAGLSGKDAEDVRLCTPGTLDSAKVSGKIVICDRGVVDRTAKSLAVKLASGAGMILANTSANSINADLHFVPTVHVDNTAGDAIKTFLAAHPGAVATIAAGTIVKDANAPQIASFSSRGPSRASGDQIKPDLSAPGVDVLAAVAPPNHNGRMFDFESGTSMSAPHVAGIAADLISIHRDWTPDMIKSALMTSAFDLKDASVDAFAQGAGQVNPKGAADPGLVYKAGFVDYVNFLCGTGQLSPCPRGFTAIAPSNLNLPSIAIGAMAGIQTVTRKVTNVGGQAETYGAAISLAGIKTEVSPASFTLAPGQTQTFTVKFTEETAPLNAFTQGFLTLTGSKGHVVRSPVAIQPVPIAAPAEVTLPSAGGSFGITTGYDGPLAYVVRGLVPATEFAGTVGQDPSTSFDTDDPDSNGGVFKQAVTIPADAARARFEIFQRDTTANDLDLYLYKIGADGKLTLVGVSGGPDASEVINRSANVPGDYVVYVDGFDTNGPTAPVRLFVWSLTTLDRGNMHVTGPATAAIGASATVNVAFTGLEAGKRYFGQIRFNNPAVAATLVRVDG
jgi:hypothetical protein